MRSQRRNLFNPHVEVVLGENLFIGFGGVHFTTPNSLASFLGILESDIALFKIDQNSHLSASINVNHNMPVSFNSLKIIYFKETGGFAQRLSLNVQSFMNMVLSAGAPFINNMGLSNDPRLKLVIAPNSLIGQSVGNDSVFSGSSAINKIFTKPINETINSGSPDGDLQIAISQGAQVFYNNTLTEILTAPFAPTALALSNEYGNSAKFTFSQTQSGFFNIEEYEVYIDNVLNNISNINYTQNKIVAINLQPNSNYTLKVRAINDALEISEFSQSYNFSTGNYIEPTYASIIQTLYSFKEHNFSHTTIIDEISSNSATFLNALRFKNYASIKSSLSNNFIGNIKVPTQSVKALMMFIYIPSDIIPSYYLVDFRPAQSSFMYNTSSGGISKFVVNGVTVSANIANIPKNQWAHVYIETSGLSTGNITLFSRNSNNESLVCAVSHISTYTTALTTGEIQDNINYLTN